MIRTGLVLAIVSTLTFGIVYKLSIQEINNREKKETETITGVVSEAIRLTNYFSQTLEDTAENRLILVSKSIAKELEGKEIEQINNEDLDALAHKWNIGELMVLSRNGKEFKTKESHGIHETDFGMNLIYLTNTFDDLIKGSYQKQDNFVMGPMGISNKSGIFFKYGFYYDQKNKFIILPWFNVSEVYKLAYNSDSNQLISNILQNNPDIKEISVLNVQAYLKKDEIKILDPKKDTPVLFGSYEMKNKDDDKVFQNMLFQKKENTLLFTNGDNTYKRFYVPLEDDRVLMITKDTSEERKVQRELMIVMIGLFVVSLGTIYLTSIIVNKKSFKDLEMEEQRLQIAEDFKRTIEVLPNSIYKIGKNENGAMVVLFNEGALNNELGITTENSKNKLIEDIYPIEFSEVVLPHFTEVFNGKEVEFNVMLNERIYHNIVKPVSSNEIAGYATDITERQKAEDKVKFLAYHDNLTSLANRLHFNEYLAKVLSQSDGQIVGVLMIDLDNFKKVNDTLGHDIGDVLLIEVGKKIKSCLYRKYDLAARLGGDEFAVIVPMINEIKDIDTIANRIIEEMKNPIQVGDIDLVKDFKVTMSIGIALSPVDGYDSAIIFKNADTAMYHAKHSGKNTYKHYNKNLEEENNNEKNN
jgi:diguanylate cyclase (GGDEF)-like protein